MGAAHTEAWLLAGDVGGTKTHVGLFRRGSDDGFEVEREATYPSARYPDLEEIVSLFLGAGRPHLDAAAFGIAGPVLDGVVQTTNLPWHVETAALAERVGCARVRLLNDLEATALGALELRRDQLRTLNAGRVREAHRAVIAAGTGLGQAVLFWDGSAYSPLATEGGHTGFAPRTETEIELLRYLGKRFGRVSAERVISGPGLLHIFEFLRAEVGHVVEGAVLDRMSVEDPAAVIGSAAGDGSCPTCREAVEIFLGAYGAQTANLTLTTMALGGVYVGGGIATKLLPFFESGTFLEAFYGAGRFEPLLREVPVQLILEPRTALLGAARAATRLASG